VDHKAGSSDEGNEEDDTVMRDDDDIPPAQEGANARTLASASSKNPGIKVDHFTAFEDYTTIFSSMKPVENTTDSWYYME